MYTDILLHYWLRISLLMGLVCDLAVVYALVSRTDLMRVAVYAGFRRELEMRMSLLSTTFQIHMIHVNKFKHTIGELVKINDLLEHW